MDAGNLQIAITGNTADFDAAILRVTSGLKDVAVQADASSKAMEVTATKFASAATAMTVAIGAFATGAIYAAAKTDELRQALDNVGGSGRTQFQNFTTEANKLGLGIEAIAKAAIKLEAAGISNDTTRKLIDSVGEAVRKMGGDDGQFTTVINGLQRIAATGIITNRSLRQIETTAPSLKEAIEQAFGTDNTKKIAAMGLSSEEFMRRIADAAANLPNHTRTINDAFTTLKNTVMTSMGSLGDTLIKDINLPGILDKVSSAIKDLIKAFQDLTPDARRTIEMFAGLMAVIGPVIIALPLLTALFSPIGIAIVAVTALVASQIKSFTDLQIAWNDIKIIGYSLIVMLQAVELAFVALATIILRLISVAGPLTNSLSIMADGLVLVQKKLEAGIATNVAYGRSLSDISKELKSLQNDQDKFDEAKGKSQTAPKGQTGENTITGVGGIKKEKEKEERIAEITKMMNDVTFFQLEEDNKRAERISLNELRLLKLYSGRKMNEILQNEEELKNTSLKLSNDTANALERLKQENGTRALVRAKFQDNEELKLRQDFFKQSNDLIKQGMAQFAMDLGVGMAKAFEKGNFQDLGKGLLSTLGSLMVQLGQMAVTIGIGLIAIKEAITKLGPFGAIAAGIGLIAIGTYFADTSSNIGNSMGSGISSSSTGGGSVGSTAPDGNLKALQNMVNNSNQKLVAKVSGNDLKFVLTQASNRSSN